jgi:hypothetical protein
VNRALLLILVAACAPSRSYTPAPASPSSPEVAGDGDGGDDAPAAGWYCFDVKTKGETSTTTCEKTEADCRSGAHDMMDVYADEPDTSVTGCRAQDVAYCFHHVPVDDSDGAGVDECEASEDSCTKQRDYTVKVKDDPKLGSAPGSEISACEERR